VSQHLLIEKQERGQGLVLRCRSDVALRRQIVQKRGHFRGAHFRRMPLASEINEAFDPVNAGLLGTAAIVLATDGCTHLIKQLGLSSLRAGNRRQFRALIHFLLFNQVANDVRTWITP
jgi:hypothetical protein